jgi:hypothetical protein
MSRGISAACRIGSSWVGRRASISSGSVGDRINDDHLRFAIRRGALFDDDHFRIACRCSGWVRRVAAPAQTIGIDDSVKNLNDHWFV